MNAPICLFVYNRLWETQQTVEALKKNFLASESDLIIFSDGSKDESAVEKVQDVRNYIHKISGFKSIQINESSVNNGLANSIISGVTNVLKNYNKIIVLEDDLITSQNFLNFMNQALDYYKNESKIQTICGYSVYIRYLNGSEDVYFQKRPLSWGWATWSIRWSKEIFEKDMLKNEINSKGKNVLQDFKKNFGNDISTMLMDSLNNKNDSWYVRWTYNHFKNATYAVYPSLSLVENIGHGESGTHCKGINSYAYKLDSGIKTNFLFPEFRNPGKKLSEQFLSYFTLKHKILYRLKLIKSMKGRRELLDDIKMRIKNISNSLTK
jgi:hypothetical protein